MVTVVRGSDPLAAELRGFGLDVTTEFGDAFGALVHVPELSTLVRTPVVELDEVDWELRGEALLRAALHDCRRAYAALRGRGGRIVLVTPTIAIVGADGFAPAAMAFEGMRTLAKTAARQWGHLGITANCVAPSLDAFGIAHDVDGPVVPALGRVPTMTDVARVVASLLGDAGAAVTGTTVIVDGGVVMAP